VIRGSVIVWKRPIVSDLFSGLIVCRVSPFKRDAYHIHQYGRKSVLGCGIQAIGRTLAIFNNYRLSK